MCASWRDLLVQTDRLVEVSRVLFPPISGLYYLAFIVSDPMELRDGMCFIGKVSSSRMNGDESHVLFPGFD